MANNDERNNLRRNAGHPISKPENAGLLKDKIKRLVMSQPFAVLCTQGNGQPYASLISHAFSDDLTTVVFATPTATRKYRLLEENERVALLVDNRPDHTDNMMEVEALTVTGRARRVEPGTDFDRCLRLLVDRHPYIKKFAASESSALFEITVTRFLHVTRFQEVNQWAPDRK